MSDKPKVYVAGVGMITSVGANAEMTSAAVNAGISGYQETNYYNKNLDPMRMAMVPDDALPPIKDELKSMLGIPSSQLRMLQLATPAFQEMILAYSGSNPLALFLSCSEALPHRPTLINKDFIKLLELQTGITLDQKNSRLIMTGRAGGIQIVEMAFKYFDVTGADFVIIGGIDTCHDLYHLGTLDMDDRVLATNIMDGFVPGEAAGFILLMSEKAAGKMGNTNLPTVYQPGIGCENGHRYSQETYTGDGLAEAFQLALINASTKPITSVYASLNGENFGAKEYGVAIVRNQIHFKDDLEIVHPADCFGDIGAAFGPVLIGLNGTHDNRLIYCSSEGQYRAAVNVQNA